MGAQKNPKMRSLPPKKKQTIRKLPFLTAFSPPRLRGGAGTNPPPLFWGGVARTCRLLAHFADTLNKFQYTQTIIPHLRQKHRVHVLNNTDFIL